MDDKMKLYFEDGRVMEFREAVYEDIIGMYDDECSELLDDAHKGKLTGYDFNCYAAMIFGVFLGDVYTSDKKKYDELTKPILEEYKLRKSLEEARDRRTLMKINNLSLIKDE